MSSGTGVSCLLGLAIACCVACDAGYERPSDRAAGAGTGARATNEPSGGAYGTGGAGTGAGGRPGGADAGGSAGEGGDAGGRGGFGWTTGGNLTGGPPDPRPEAPPWDAPFPVESEGWRESPAPLCETHRGPLAGFSVWADERGVFAIATRNCQHVGRDLPFCPPENGKVAGTTIEFNDGTGWHSVLEGQVSTSAELSGFPAGPLILAGVIVEGAPEPEACSVALIDEEYSYECALRVSDEITSSRVFVVSSSLAYALSGKSVLRYEDGVFRKLVALPEEGSAIWANEAIVVVATSFGAFSFDPAEPDGVRPFPEMPVGIYSSVWGFAADDVWFGNAAGQLVHYDGRGYRILSVQRDAVPEPISGLWGAEGSLFFYTSSVFGRIRGDRDASSPIEFIIAPGLNPGDGAPRFSLRGLWGLSADEVFLSLEDGAYDQYACGGSIVVWFDGQSLHRF